MKKKRTYATVDVERFDLHTILTLLTVDCIVAVDVAKTKFVAAIATATGEVLRLVRFEHPRQTGAFLRLIEALREAKLSPRVVMEPTGTYGDALRYQCQLRHVPVHMMSPKHTHDFAEVLDGVPSMHDPKAAVVLARLAVIKPGKPWAAHGDERRDLRALLDQRWPVTKIQALYHGHLEGMLARHWPEFGGLLNIHEQRSWMTLLQQYPGPQTIVADREKATQTLHDASRGRLPTACIAAVVDTARTTLGVPMTKGEQEKLQDVVESIAQQIRKLDAIDKVIASRVSNDVSTSQIATVVGAACAAAIVAYLGSPLEFQTPSALEKAMGLNLKVRSSGEAEGKFTVGITKRGPAQVRQLLYLAALRLLHDRVIGPWYRARRAYGTELAKKRAVVAVMRKLARALWHVARGATFDTTKLFDVRRLDLTADAHDSRAPTGAHAKAKPQGGDTQPHSIA